MSKRKRPAGVAKVEDAAPLGSRASGDAPSEGASPSPRTAMTAATFDEMWSGIPLSEVELVAAVATPFGAKALFFAGDWRMWLSGSVVHLHLKDHEPTEHRIVHLSRCVSVRVL